MSERKSHLLTIKPAIEPEKRHKVEEAMKKLGYIICGGGQMVDGSECDISFDERVGIGEA